MMDKYGYVYKTTNLINDKIYIGQHKYNSDKLDESYLGSGLKLKRAIDKYGVENFRCEIIEWCNNRQELNEKEKYWIDALGSLNPNIGYNIAHGGEGGCTNLGRKMPADAVQKHRQALKQLYADPNYYRPMLGKHHSSETKRKIGEQSSIRNAGVNNPMYGKHWSDEWKQQQSERMKVAWQNNPLYERKWSDKKHQQMSQALTGRHWYTNGTNNVFAFECPEGYYKGMTRSDEAQSKQLLRQSKTHWYTNGINNIRLFDCEEIPDGYHKGKTNYKNLKEE